MYSFLGLTGDAAAYAENFLTLSAERAETGSKAEEEGKQKVQAEAQESDLTVQDSTNPSNRTHSSNVRHQGRSDEPARVERGDRRREFSPVPTSDGDMGEISKRTSSSVYDMAESALSSAFNSPAYVGKAFCECTAQCIDLCAVGDVHATLFFIYNMSWSDLRVALQYATNVGRQLLNHVLQYATNVGRALCVSVRLSSRQGRKYPE